MTRVLPAEQYDRLKAEAEKYGGVGSASMFDDGKHLDAPRCGYGLGYAAGLVNISEYLAELEGGDEEYETEFDRIEQALFSASSDLVLPFSWNDSDVAVRDAADELGLSVRSRVPFDLWAKHLGLVRGE